MGSNRELYIEFLNGEEQSFEAIVLYYRKGLTGYLYTITKDYHIAEEIAEDVFVKLWFRKPSYTERASLKHLSIP